MTGDKVFFFLGTHDAPWVSLIFIPHYTTPPEAVTGGRWILGKPFCEAMGWMVIGLVSPLRMGGLWDTPSKWAI